MGFSVIHIETYRSVKKKINVLFKRMKTFLELKTASNSAGDIKLKIRFIQCKHSKSEHVNFLVKLCIYIPVCFNSEVNSELSNGDVIAFHS